MSILENTISQSQGWWCASTGNALIWLILSLKNSATLDLVTSRNSVTSLSFIKNSKIETDFQKICKQALLACRRTTARRNPGIRNKIIYLGCVMLQQNFL